MEEKKYKLVKEDTIEVDGRTLYRIKSLKRFNDVFVGDLGGYVESEQNLSHEYNCWIYNNSMVYDKAKITYNAMVRGYNCRVYESAWIYGNATIYDSVEVSGDAEVYDWARIYNNVKIFGNAKVCDDAIIEDNAKIYEYARIYDNAHITGDSKIYGDCSIFGSAWIECNSQIYDNSVVCGYAQINGATVCGNSYIQFGTISENAIIKHQEDYIFIHNLFDFDDDVTFFKLNNGHIGIDCCLVGVYNLDDFKTKLIERSGLITYLFKYRPIIKMIESQLR